MLSGGRGPQINVTPMIDILLVLLIVFMIIVPGHSVGLPSGIPDDSRNPPAATPEPTGLVIWVISAAEVRVNRDAMAMEDLAARLRQVARPELAAFIGADRELEFASVARVIDIARGAGIRRIGLLPSGHGLGADGR